jgi:hypothetical protein
MQFSFYISKRDFCKVAKKSLLQFATLTQGESSYKLNAAPNTQSWFFFLFCVIWAASFRRLKSRPKSGIMLLTLKKVTQVDIFLGNCLQQNDQ